MSRGLGRLQLQILRLLVGSPAGPLRHEGEGDHGIAEMVDGRLRRALFGQKPARYQHTNFKRAMSRLEALAMVSEVERLNTGNHRFKVWSLQPAGLTAYVNAKGHDDALHSLSADDIEARERHFEQLHAARMLEAQAVWDAILARSPAPNLRSRT